MPLAVGNSWTFVQMPAPGYMGDTTTQTLTIARDTVMTLSIDQALEIGRWYKVTGAPLGAVQYLNNRPNGLWQVIFFNDPTLGKITIINRLAEFPASVGDTFLQPYPPPLQSGTSVADIISTDSLISVPAGNFRCIVYRFKLLSDHRPLYDVFYAPGIGRIKTNSYGLAPVDTSVTIVTRLTGYNFSK